MGLESGDEMLEESKDLFYDDNSDQSVEDEDIDNYMTE